MMNPRQIRSLWARPLARPSALTALAVLFGLIFGAPAGAAASVPHSHTRRPLPTVLRTAAVSEGSNATAGKHHTSPRAKAGARSAGAAAPSASPRAGSKARGKRRSAEPPADPVPMYRVRGGGGGAREQRAVRRGQRNEPRSYTREAALRPASTDAYGRKRSMAARGSWRALTVSHPVASTRAESRNQGIGNSHTALHESQPSVAEVVPTSRISRPFAQGVAHPDDDERFPRDLPAAGSEDEGGRQSSGIPVGHIAAAAPASAQQAPATSSLVQGFGGEVIVPSASDADRPGGTRRRNHPANWIPQAMNLSAEPLDEREAITEAAVSPLVLPLVYDRNGRLVMPAPLKGSRDILLHQNVMATSDGLERIQDDADLDRLRMAHLLINFPVSESLRVSEDLPVNRRCARPWTVSFAADTGRAFYARFHQPLQVNSAVRTVSYQTRLQLVNGNAAATSGDAASPHLTGQALDFAKRGMTQAQLAWMRDYLLPIMRAGKIDVEEEFQQACFHISVYRSYAPARRPAHELAQRSVLPVAVGVALPSSPEEQ